MLNLNISRREGIYKLEFLACEIIFEDTINLTLVLRGFTGLTNLMRHVYLRILETSSRTIDSDQNCNGGEDTRLRSTVML